MSVLLLVALVVACLVYGRRALEAVQALFERETSALDLAVFRVALFATLLVFFDQSVSTWFNGLPRELQFPPHGLGWLSDLVPLAETHLKITSLLFTAACVTGMLGLFSRTSSGLALVCGIILLGIPQLFGKVNHSHHLMWFLMILAVSPCGDALSIDAIRRAWRRAGQGLIHPPAPSTAYSRPLVFVWILLGIVYFFPGLWKLSVLGIDWFLGENLRNHLYLKWSTLQDWQPILRIDQIPTLLKFSGMATIVFELSFIALIFFPLGRLIATVAGLMFHNATWATMKISFWILQTCYVAFVPWQRLFAWLGERVHPTSLIVVYDASSTGWRRVIAVLHTLDLLQRTRYVPVSVVDPDIRSIAARASVPNAGYVVSGGNATSGLPALRLVALRNPVFWPLLVLTGGKWRSRLLREACSRLLRRADRKAGQRVKPSTAGPHKYVTERLVVGLGIVLIIVTTVCGVLRISSWPFAAYPTFASYAPTEVPVMTIEAAFPDGTSRRVSLLERERLAATPERVWGLQGHALRIVDRQRQNDVLKAIWHVLARDDPSLRFAREIRFFRSVHSTLPEHRNNPPIERELMLTLRFQR